MVSFDFDVKKIKNLVFDVGGILLGYRWEDMFKDHGTDREKALRIGRGLFDSEDWTLYDSGFISTKELIDRFCIKYPDLEEEARWFLNNAILMRVPREKVYEELEIIKEKGYKISLLSNYSQELFELHTSDLPFRKITDGELVSYMVKTVKPNREIYEILRDRFSLNPIESVFFDDREDNVNGAIACGFNGVHIKDQSEELLLEYLRQF